MLLDIYLIFTMILGDKLDSLYLSTTLKINESP